MNFTPELFSQISETHTVVMEMKYRLFGNGQPGDLEKLQGRLKSLELWRAMLTGGWLVSVAVLGYLLNR